MLVFVRSIREGNFDMYVQSLTQTVSCIFFFFALDHTHYYRWLLVHIRDMMMLSEKHSSVFAEFKAGNFVINKTGHKFSAIAIDQCREQSNARVKGSGGAIGLMENPGGLRRWTVAGPEIVRITEKFESGKDQGEEKRHHGAQPGLQRKFVNEVMSLVTTIDEMITPSLKIAMTF